MASKTALVTGAGSGVGRAVTLALLARGFEVVLVGRRIAALEETREHAGQYMGQAITCSADVSDPTSVDSLYQVVQERVERLDVLFNNAGTNVPSTPFEDLSFEQWQTVMSTNLTGAFLMAQGAFRLMKSQTPRGGRIINNGSVSAHVPRPNAAPYTSSKHAITGLTRSLSLDGRAHDIACGQIDIGNAATELASRMSSGALQADGSVKPEPLIDPRHIAEAVVYMASLPLDANVQFMTVMATKMPYAGRG